MFKIDPTARHLAREFRETPRGPHSPDLQCVINLMRGVPIAGKHVVVLDKATGRYVVAQMTGRRGEPVVRHEEQSFATLDEAEWFIFRTRWHAHTGEMLDE